MKALAAAVDICCSRAARRQRHPDWSARGVLIGSAASIPITHLTPFNQHRLTLCRPYFLTRDKNAKLIKES
jgi:hypothetical protein